MSIVKKLYRRKKRSIQAIARNKIRKLPYKMNGTIASLRLSQRKIVLGEEVVFWARIPSRTRCHIKRGPELKPKRMPGPWKTKKRWRKISSKWLIQKKSLVDLSCNLLKGQRRSGSFDIETKGCKPSHIEVISEKEEALRIESQERKESPKIFDSLDRFLERVFWMKSLVKDDSLTLPPVSRVILGSTWRLKHKV